MSHIITAEQVSSGHPDKICDQIADAIVTDCLYHDKNSRVAVECLFKGDELMIAGEITSSHEPNFGKIVGDVINSIDDRTHFGLKTLHIHTAITSQSPDIAQGVDKGGAGDQGIMYGYATKETPELLPIPFALATYFIDLLENRPSELLLSDAKAQVSFDYDTGRITTFLCSVQHVSTATVDDFRKLIEDLMVFTANEYGLNTDFEKLVNPSGRFVLGGPAADCGVTGRKLACDTYGGIGHIGGGALSGKDPTKVDRSAAYMARKIAVDLVSTGFCDKCEIQLSYAIGKPEPVGIAVETFDTAVVADDFFLNYIRKHYDLTPQGMIKALHLLDVNYNYVSSGGHFGKSYLPWEMDDASIEEAFGSN